MQGANSTVLCCWLYPLKNCCRVFFFLKLTVEVETVVQLLLSMVHQGVKPSRCFDGSNRAISQEVTDHAIKGACIGLDSYLLI